MVWDRNLYTARMNLIIINDNLTDLQYKEKIIALQPFLSANGPAMILQEENARHMWHI